MMRTSRTTGVVDFDPTTDLMAPPHYVIHAIVDGLDEIARGMERKWGIGRLRLLVSDLLRAKFDSQKAKLDAAIEANREPYIRAQAEGMKRAYAALDQAAQESGHQPLSSEVWECILPSSGEVITIVRSEPEAHHLCRNCRVFTLDEIALLIDALPKPVLEAKRILPGATVARVGTPEIDWERGDDLPF